ncbi:gem-associated protein [Anaeramoeba ignava]|uniref:Gem-associated protein n=1 Tax=Anaeramoeba ignava TaxID=1746090 RepID=A0A9Q0LFU0_ANAIG|nr:gem-associated protein [Anaeramoeba ignava]
MEKEKEKEKEMNYLLRKKSLQFWKFVENSKVEIEMIEGTKTNGMFRLSNGNQTEFQISELETPIGIYPEAIVRSEDICLMHFQK